MKKHLKIIGLSIFSLFLVLCSHIALASSLTSQPQVKKFINQVASHYKYSPKYVAAILRRAHFNREVIIKMEHPYEALPWHDYVKLFVTPERVSEGIKYWDRSNKLVAWEEKEHGVPGSVILAIIGIESKYGREMGTFNVLNTLTTLAFHYPTRAKFFRSELGAFIAMARAYRVNPYTTLGSYAGAMGQCQFMPSSYLHYAVDFHGKGRPNLFSDKADVIFSVGNYLKQNGWEVGQPIATPARLTGVAYRKILKDGSGHPVEPTMTLHQLARYGVSPAHGHFKPSLTANLIKLRGSHGPQYWIAFHNFYVITTYNASDLYAMAAYQLSQKLQQAWNAKQNG